MGKYKVETSGGTYMVETDDTPVPAGPDERSAMQVAKDQTIQMISGIPEAITGIPGMLKTAGGMISDTLQGKTQNAVKTAADTVRGMMSPVTIGVKNTAALVEALGGPRTLNAATPEETAKGARTAGAEIGGTALGELAAKGIPAITEAIPSRARAGANFQRVMEVAQNVPLDVTAAEQVAQRAAELGKRGSTMPKIFRDFARQRNVMPQPSDFVPNAETSPVMDYRTGRDFASNAGALSVTERMAANPQMGRQVAQFADAMKTANREAAVKVGMGDLYDQAMKEYRQASTMQAAADVVKKYALRAGLTGLGLAEAYHLIRGH